jgi:5-methylcytosine-specific restriction endonuclease McrA
MPLSQNNEFDLNIQEKKDRPCSDCGIKYPYYVMQFDHLNDKKYPISKLVNSNNMKKLELELAKCEVVCANCHAERTHQRGVAQLVERWSPKPKVAGSNPVSPARYLGS